MANYIKDVGWLLDAAVVNLAESAVEASIKTNADFHSSAGLRPKVVRKSSGSCCPWCDSLEGEYDYPNVPREVWQRHERCNCVVEYDPGDGRRQDVYTKKWREQAEREERIKFATGAQHGAKKTEGWEGRHADLYYEEIRNRAPYSDAEKIAENIKDYSVEEIEEIRKHIFVNEHKRNGTIERFDTDYDIAQAWQRLIEGKEVKESDIVLLNHEKMESEIMKRTGCSYEEAHAIAEKKYNWVEAQKAERKK